VNTQIEGPRGKENGVRYDHGLNGASGSSTAPEAEQAQSAGAKGASVETYTAEELQGMEFEPPRFICDSIIVEGCTILGGRPKMGKSWFALDLAYGVATGTPVMGRECEQGDVLYCALEDNPRRLQDRLRHIARDDDDWSSSLHLANAWPKGKDTISAFHAWRKSVENPKLIIVDTLKKIKSKPSGGKGENYNDDYEAVEILQQFYLETGISVLILTHTRKADADDPFDLITGTLGQTGAADNIMVMERTKGGPITLHGTGRDMEGYSHAVSFNKDARKWEIKGDAYAPPKTRNRKLSAAHSHALKAIREVFEAGNSFEHLSPAFLGVGDPVTVQAIRESDAEAIFKATHTMKNAKSSNASRMAWVRAMKNLSGRRIIERKMHGAEWFVWWPLRNNPFSEAQAWDAQ
jgi:hypothetical protein